MKILITHTDLDGVGPVVLMKNAGIDVEIVFCECANVNATAEEIFDTNPDTEIIITDLSISLELARKFDGSNRVTLIDHHATELALNEFAWCHVQTHKGKIQTAATELVYDWLIEQGLITRTPVLDQFVELVRDRDTWRWAALGKIECKQVNDLFFIYGREHFIDWTLSQLNGDTFPVFSEVDNLLLANRQKEIDIYIGRKEREMTTITLCGKQCGVVFAENYFSELGNTLAARHPEVDFVAMIDMGRKSVSYRTVRNDVNVGVIARQFGGGGHPESAGSQFSAELQAAVANLVFGN